MPATVQSTSPGDILTGVVEQLRTALALHATKVRAVIDPDPSWDNYTPENNVAVRLDPPQPYPESGAGRRGYTIYRTVQVWLTTVSLGDPAGDGTLAAAQHYNLEDIIIDALTANPPDSTTTGFRPIKYVGGGESPQRLTKDDPGSLKSCLMFLVGYVPALTVS